MSRFRFQLMLLLLVLVGCSKVRPSVRLSPAPSPRTSVPIYADSHYRFVLVMHGTEAEVLVANTTENLPGDPWKRITEVSLRNAKLGHSPTTVEIYWDFSKSYRGREYAPMPLRTGSDGYSGFSVLPDLIEFDANRSVYLVWFSTINTTDDTVPTRLEIRKEDLDEAFKQQAGSAP